MTESRTADTCAADLARVLGRPCLLAAIPTLRRTSILALRRALADLEGETLDVVLYSHGGDIDAAYVVARELRRRFESVRIFVPLLAKSAATLVCLVADELVLGPLGELGPLDGQCPDRRNPDGSGDASCVLPFRALGQLREEAAAQYRYLLKELAKGPGMTRKEASRRACMLTGSLLGRVFARVDPDRIAEDARALEVGTEYACRLLRRYQPDLHACCQDLTRRLLEGYPSHGFVIDLEELRELGLPARGPEPAEAPILDALAVALAEQDDAQDLITVVEPGTVDLADGSSVPPSGVDGDDGPAAASRLACR
jgi:hypothetical protein